MLAGSGHGRAQQGAGEVDVGEKSLGKGGGGSMPTELLLFYFHLSCL